jgi:hypothetical protein
MNVVQRLDEALEACRQLDDNIWSIDSVTWARKVNPDLVTDARDHIVALEHKLMHAESAQAESEFLGVPVEYQYCYPDGYWRCSRGEMVNGQRPVASRALYAKRDGT